MNFYVSWLYLGQDFYIDHDIEKVVGTIFNIKFFYTVK